METTELHGLSCKYITIYKPIIAGRRTVIRS